MAAASSSNCLQSTLQAAVQSVKWTYSLFWQICPQQGILIWGDGYYNGPIKTRKTVQPMEVSAEEASLQRSQQLRELYDSLSACETNQPPARRPSAALSPEDLTETEWFYLMCVSFSFPPGVGLPGKAYSRRQHVWLTGANEVDSKTFSRAILAKSARIQTVVCIPLLDGVVELGTTEKVQEDVGFTTHVKSFFADHQPPHPPKPALSEHSTSNPATSSGHPRFNYSPPGSTIMYTAAAVDPPVAAHQADADDDEEDEEEEDEEDHAESDSEAETGRAASHQQVVGQHNPQAGLVGAAEQSELMQLEMSEDIRLGSPDDGSNNLDSDFHMLTVNKAVGNIINPADHQRRVDSFRAESSRRWQMPEGPPRSSGLNVGPPPHLHELSQEDTHYSQTISTILQGQPNRWAEMSSVTGYVLYSAQSAFSKWMARADHLLHVPTEGTSQWLLKYILFSVPFLHNKYKDENSPKSRDGESSARFRKGTPQDELSANHVLAERRRREKLNERFIILRSLVPFVTKMDKASILGDTIEYVKQLRMRIQDLETKIRQMETDLRSRLGDPARLSSSKEQRSSSAGAVDRAACSAPPGTEKRKMRIVEGSGTVVKPKAVESPPPPPTPTSMETSVQVSIIESNGLIELQCPHKEGLLLDVMQMLRELRIEITAVQSSLTNGFFMAELKAKVKENVNGKKASIVEVKRAIQQLIPHAD
ncbi:transcription factor BHLH42-like isoform X2 [Punica granatum]|uniref:Transcription factor BHLH42-like isoform X2 n=1 Tax=Punica granatum TaxID=22663 RepID=A0A6P8E636_PUNGR|nr:transcription factor BHLH42-like isoform X2 [Punica granatum]